VTGEEAARAPGPSAPDAGFRRYDLLKEFVIALVVVTILSGALAGIFSSPDRNAVTIANWAKTNPLDFVTTAVSELDGTSTTATYGPPYNHTAGAGQKIGPVSLQRLAGVHIPVDAAHDFVLTHSAPSLPTSQTSRRRSPPTGPPHPHNSSAGPPRITTPSNTPTSKTGPSSRQLRTTAQSRSSWTRCFSTPSLAVWMARS